MALSNLTVEIVSPEKRVWSGEATMVSARTIEGDIGILPDHAPLVGVLKPASDETSSIKKVNNSLKSPTVKYP